MKGLKVEEKGNEYLLGLFTFAFLRRFFEACIGGCNDWRNDRFRINDHALDIRDDIIDLNQKETRQF
jgi:hypothetical protein